MLHAQLTLAAKIDREHQSHAILLRLRELIQPLKRDGIFVKVVEVPPGPPGPPVLSTLVAEIYGNTLTTHYEEQRQAVGILMTRLAKEPFAVDVDSSVESHQKRWRFEVDKEKAALSGISTEEIALTLNLANQGHVAGTLMLERETKPTPIRIQLPLENPTNQEDMGLLPVKKTSKLGIFFAGNRLK